MLGTVPVAPRRRDVASAWGIAIFTLIAVVGLYHAKWNPYYHKVFLAAAKHSIGASIVSGKTAAAPAPGWASAWGYTVAYTKAIWQALIVGLLLGAGVQALLPRAWLLRLLGRSDFSSTAVAGLAALPGMM